MTLARICKVSALGYRLWMTASFQMPLSQCGRSLAAYNKNNNIGEFKAAPFEVRPDEEVHVKRSRLQYQSRKRGMLENCILFSTFASKHLSTFDPVQLDMYDRLLNVPSNDWEIYYWATGAKPTPAEFDNDVMALLKAHVKNNQKELRGIPPNLTLFSK